MPTYAKHLLSLSLLLFSAWAMANQATEHPKADFKLPSSDGETIQLSDYQGKWAVVNFWATWCGPCIHEIPELRAFHTSHSDKDAVVIGVDFEQIEIQRLNRFIKQYAINYPIALVGEAPLLPFEPLKGLPSTFIVNPQGKLVHRHVGPIKQDQLEELLEKLKTSSSD